MDAATITRKLGMSDLLEADEAQELHYLEQIQAGIPIDVLDIFIDAGILSKEDAVRCIGSDRTLGRRRAEAGRLNQNESDKFFRLIRLVIQAVEVFGTTEKANKWFYTPNKALDNRAPYQLLDTDLGSRLVEKVLGRIAYGVYS